MKKAIKPQRKRSIVRKADALPYMVMLDSGEIVYRCSTISQGVAFLAGRREGTLYGKLCTAASELTP